MPRSTVGLARQDSRRQTIYQALDLVRAEVTPKLAEQVMLKPNFLSNKNQLASSHVDAMRGAIDFLLSTPTPPQEILIAEGGNEDYSGQAFETFGYHALLDEYDLPIQLIDLNQETDWVETTIYLADRSEATIRMPRTVLNCPCTISVAIPKTHDTCVVTLALKNLIMGTIHKKDRVKMHGYRTHKERAHPPEAQAFNISLIRLARFLSPDISLIDGWVGLQGNGPGGTDAVEWGIAAAGVDVIAVDTVVSKAMGFEPLELGFLAYARQLGLGQADLAQIDVRGTPIEAIQRSFKPHETTELQLQWQVEDAGQYLPTVR